jgi:signal transduction histidine kinase
MEAAKGILTLTTQVFQHQVAISIRDNGPGIPRETQNRMFEPYFSRKPGGLGIGLAGALSIVQSHGGRIEVH